MADAGLIPVLELSDRPDTWRTWLRDVRNHLDVMLVLAGKDFRTRYKRASLGIAWAVIVPVLQASIMAVIFSRVVKFGGGSGYGVYVMSGVIPFFYFSSVLNASVTSIVEGASLTDKVWFPRIILAVVPVISNLVGLITGIAVLLVAMPVLGVDYSIRLLLLPVAVIVLIAMVTSLALVLSALNVYFRDVRYLVQASLTVWMYITPIVYTQSLLKSLAPLVVANPLTGVIALFRIATVGAPDSWGVPLIVSLGITVLLTVVGLEAHRRRDRLFVDLL